MPGGRPPREKSFFNALSIALKEANGTTLDGAPNTKLRQIADKLVEAALSGESWAIREVADRVDGKPMQAIEHSGEIETSSKEQREAAVAAAIQAARDEHEQQRSKLN
jgi:hypothetical protein